MGNLHTSGGTFAEIQINLNICSNNKHMEEIEWINRTVKEQVRGIYNTIHLKNFTWHYGRRSCRPRHLLAKRATTFTFCGRETRATPDHHRPYHQLHKALPPPVRKVLPIPRIQQQHHAGANHWVHCPTAHWKLPRRILLHDPHYWQDTEP